MQKCKQSPIHVYLMPTVVASAHLTRTVLFGLRMALTPCPSLNLDRCSEGRWQKEATSHQRGKAVIL